MPAPVKHYLGDGVYVHHDGFAVVLTADDEGTFQTIILEPQTYENLRQFVEHLPSAPDATGHP
jgi:hypothetical protein